MKRLMIVIALLAWIFVACSIDETTGNDISNEEAETDTEQQSELNGKTTEEKIDGVENDEDGVDEEDEIELQYYIAEDSSVVPLHNDVNEQVVLLTFDDAPSTYTMEMAETLKKLDAGAIFFVNGHLLDTPESEEQLKQLHEMGFLIGNHTYNHPLLTDISEEEQRDEIIRLSDRIEEIIGERPKFFRAPNGMNTDFSEQLVEEEGMVLMNWTYGFDYFEPYMDAEKLAEAMITGEGPEVGVSYSLLKPGANLLMHDREWTNEALEAIVEGLRDNGYEIVDPTLIQVMDEED